MFGEFKTTLRPWFFRSYYEWSPNFAKGPIGNFLFKSCKAGVSWGAFSKSALSEHRAVLLQSVKSTVVKIKRGNYKDVLVRYQTQGTASHHIAKHREESDNTTRWGTVPTKLDSTWLEK